MLGKGGLQARPRKKHQDPSYQNKQNKQRFVMNSKMNSTIPIAGFLDLLVLIEMYSCDEKSDLP